jgi:hypothetical protein
VSPVVAKWDQIVKGVFSVARCNVARNYHTKDILLSQNDIRPSFVATEEQVADMCTIQFRPCMGKSRFAVCFTTPSSCTSSDFAPRKKRSLRVHVVHPLSDPTTYPESSHMCRHCRHGRHERPEAHDGNFHHQGVLYE